MAKVKKLIPCVILLSAILISCRHENNEEGVKEYEILEIGEQEIDIPETYAASIRGSQDVDIYPQVSGIMTKVCVTEGQRVKQGELLFVIDQVPYHAALRNAKANVSAARAKVERARLELEAKKALFDEKVVSDYELSAAKNDYALSVAELEQMNALETEARNNLSYTEVRSPVNGVVGTLPYMAGSLVGPSITRPLTTVSDNAVIYVYFSMNENRWRDMIRNFATAEDAIRNMPAVRLRLNDGTLYEQEGKIVSASGIVNLQTGTVSVRCEFSNQKGELLSGSIGNIILSGKEKDMVVIPQRAANELQDKLFVYKVESRENTHYVKGVEIKADKMTDGKHYVVRSGLAPGDTIISNGVGLLRDGMEVKIARGKEREK